MEQHSSRALRFISIQKNKKKTRLRSRAFFNLWKKNRRNLYDSSGSSANGGGLGIPLSEQQQLEITQLYFQP
jgi:hypothetical protein